MGRSKIMRVSLEFNNMVKRTKKEIQEATGRKISEPDITRILSNMNITATMNKRRIRIRRRGV